MTAGRALRLAAATLVLAGGAIHLQLLLDDYGTDDIRWAFVLNVAASAVVAAALVVRPGLLGVVAGIGVGAGSLVALALTRMGDGFLDFRERGLEPSPQTPLTVLVEGAAVAALGALLARRSWRLEAAEGGHPPLNPP